MLKYQGATKLGKQKISNSNHSIYRSILRHVIATCNWLTGIGLESASNS